MPSLSLSNSLTKARDSKRSQSIINEPMTLEASHDDWYSIADDTLGGAGIGHHSGGYVTYQNTTGSDNGYMYKEFLCVPYSTYNHATVSLATLSGGGAKIWIGIEKGDDTYSDVSHPSTYTFASGGASKTGDFTVGNVTSFFVSLVTDTNGSKTYWDSIKIEETG